ncbi:DUF5057 domain-containing protein [Vallitalea okinawensis]|uniref:DUF5057 domain-containing protein n=1 Tax=Vallitalea okinawensis TaxID=2078660 RepID=UPI001300B854|nr:DUF5057 domain-containing protein [Vallitalea okinawensis]
MKKILSMILCITMVFSIWTTPVEATDSTNHDINDGKIVHILEIQPTNSYELSSYSSRSDVTVTQMPMGMFVSQREELNGKYDLIYIGMKTGEYSPLINYTPDGGNNGNHPDFITSSTSNQSGTSVTSKKKYLLNFDNNRMLGEVFPGNDITTLQSEAIKEVIESGQLVLFDESIFQTNYDNTKLYENFLSYKEGDYENFLVVDQVTSELNDLLDDISNGERVLRPKLVMSSVPLDYTKDGIPTYQEDTEDRWLRFSYQLQGYQEHNYEVKLYLDINGDGIFKDEEVFVTRDILNPDSAIVDYMLPVGFIGMLGWKVEIIDKITNVKTYETGYTAFKHKNNVGEPIEIKVLQIYPNNNGGSNSKDIFDLSSLENISGNNLLSEDGLFEITVDRMGSKEFNTNPGELNGKYDMIIIGFSDSVSKTADINSPQALAAIESFVETGQSLMITHDMFHFYVGDIDRSYMKFTQKFRDPMGQNIYAKDYMNSNNESLYDWREEYPVKNGVEYNSVGFTRPHMERYYNKYSYKPSSDYSITSYVGNSLKTTTQAYKLNTGAINMFPYILHPTDTDKDLSIATTHAQYYMADLEDEDLIVWYTLNSSYYDEFDARNNYYVYSLGNVTYSGTGHKSPSGKVEENKLFVNTMLKAASSANHAPIVQVSRISDNKEYFKSQDEIVFDVLVSDFDLKDLESELRIYINNDKSNDFNDDGNPEVIYDEQIYPSAGYEVVTNDEYMEIRLDKEDFNNLNDFDLKIVASDSQGAEGDKEITGLKNSDDTQLVLSSDTGWTSNEILDGDHGEMHIGLGVEISTANLELIESISFENVKLKVSADKEDYIKVINESTDVAGWTKSTTSDKVMWTKSIGDLNFSKTEIENFRDHSVNLYEDDSFDLLFSDITNKISFDVEITNERFNHNFSDLIENNNLKVSKGMISLMVLDENDSPMGVQKVKVNGKEYTTAENGTVSVTDLPGSGVFNVEYDFNTNVYEQVTLTVQEDNGEGVTQSTVSSTNGLISGSVDLKVSSNPIKATIQISYNDDLNIKFGNGFNLLLRSTPTANVVIEDQVYYAELKLDLPIDIDNIDFIINLDEIVDAIDESIIPNGDVAVLMKERDGIEEQVARCTTVLNADNTVTINYDEPLDVDSVYTFRVPIMFEKDKVLDSDIDSMELSLTAINLTPSGESEKVRINRTDSRVITCTPLEDIVYFSNHAFGVFEYSGNGSFRVSIEAFDEVDIDDFSLRFKVVKAAENSGGNLEVESVINAFEIKNVVTTTSGVDNARRDNDDYKYLLIDKLPKKDGTYEITLRAKVEDLPSGSSDQYFIIIEEINHINVESAVDLNDDDNQLKRKIEVLKALDLE